MSSFGERAVAVGIAATLLSIGTRAFAQNDDGAYGRLSGDLAMRADAGVGFSAGGPSFDASLAALYMSTCGPYVHYTDALGSDAPHAMRTLSAGVRLEPLFLGRYASNLESGPAHLDLLLDSFAFDLGALWWAPSGKGMRPRPGIEVGLGFALPILPSANGPVIGLRGALRWHEEDLIGPREGGVIDRGALLSLTLGYRHVVGVHLVDSGDRVAR